MLNKNQDNYLEVAHVLRKMMPYLHAFSGTTTAIFFVMFLATRDVIASFVLVYPFWSYAALTIIGAVMAYKLETLIMGVIDATGFAVTDYETHQNKLFTGGLLAIALPFILFTASTSFVGVDHSLGEVADAQIKKSKAKAISRMDSLSHAVQKECDKKVKLLEDKHSQSLRLIAEKWQGQADMSKNGKTGLTSAKKAYIVRERAKEEQRLEAKHNKAVQDVIKRCESGSKSKIELHSKLINELDKAETVQATRYKGFGNWLGVMAVISVILSALSSVTYNWILRQLPRRMVDQFNNQFGKKKVMTSAPIKPQVKNQVKQQHARPKQNNYQSSMFGQKKDLTQGTKEAIKSLYRSVTNGDTAAYFEMHELIEELKRQGWNTQINEQTKTIGFERI